MLNGCQLIDRGWHYLYLNDAAVRHNRRPREELLGRTMQECYPGLEATPIFATLKTCMESGTPARVETKFTFPDGTVAWFEVSVQPVPEGILILSHDVTDRHRAEAALRESEARLRAIFEAEPECVKLLAADGSLLSMNPAGLRMIEADSFQQVEHRCVYPLVVEEHRAAFRALTEQVLRGESSTLEFQITGLKGGRRWLETHASPFRDPAGKITAVLGITRDITARKAAEAERDRLFNSSIDLLCVAGRDGFFKQLNPAWTRALGWMLEELMARPWLEFVHPDDREASLQAKATIEGDQPVLNFENRYRHRDGSYRWLQWKAAPVPAGERVFAVARDITERKRAEAALRESEARLREVVRAANVGLWDWDLPSDTVWFSPEWKRQIGHEDHEVPHRFAEWEGRVHPDDLPAALAKVRAYLAKPWPNYENEFRFRHKDGTYRWILARASLLTGPEGKPVRMLGSHLDITERKRAEAALRESEERFRLLVDHAPEAVVLLDPETGRFAHSNPAAERLLGLSAAELTRCGPVECSPSVQPDGQPSGTKARALVAAALAGEKPVFEWTHRAASGRDIPCEVRLLRINLWGRAILRGSVLDISERKAAEARIRQLSRTYAVLSDINQTIVREKDPQALLTAVCRIAVEKGGFGLAWVGLVATDGQLRVAAHAGAAGEALEVVRAFVEGPRPDCAFTYHALNHGERALCLDIAGDERASGWREAALAHGCGAMASLPLRVGERTVGTFNLYAGAAGFFDADELRLLDELAGDIGFALETHETERERLRAEQTLRDLIRTVDGIVWVADPDTFRFTFVSLHAERLLGYPVERWLTEPDFWTEHLHPEDRERAVRYCVASTQAGRDHQFEYRMLAADGRAVWMRDLVTVAVEDGRPVKLRGIMVDVTAAKEAEAALRESEERFRQMAENIDEVVWMTDAEKTRMLYVSPAYERIWGREREELNAAPRAWLDAIVPEDRERVRLAATTRQATGDYREEYRIQRPDGSRRWISERAFPIKDATGRVYRVVGVAEDVTERKKLEEQVLHAQRMEAIGTLAGGVAHDLNNILAPVLMMMGILKLKLTEAADRQLIDLVESSVQRGAGIINQLLLFSRHVAGDNAPLDLRHLLREMVALMREIFPRNINIVEPKAATLPPVLGDATQLHQVLMNLCVNARDAMPKGGTLALTAREIRLEDTQAFPHPEARPGRYVVIGVQDTGHGIPKNIRNRIFDPFFTTKEAGKGTGLGLSTVLGIVRNHGGFMTVYSEEGLGTHFKVYLPAAEPSAKPEEPSAVATPARGHGETILVVDDENSVLLAEQFVLEQNGYQVLTAAGGKEAVHCFLNNQDRIRLVLTDLMMPGMDGIALARSLRATHRTLPIIATTGLDREEKRDTLAALGITDVLTKPCLPSVLLAAVRRNLDR